MILIGENHILGEKPVTVPVLPPQIPHITNWDRTRSFVVRGMELMA
jgi:hypothetical protein